MLRACGIAYSVSAAKRKLLTRAALLRYIVQQPRCRQLGNPAAPADDHNGNENHKHDGNRR